MTTTAPFNANQYQDIYQSLGIDTGDLGCIMLDTASIPVTSWVDDAQDDLFYGQGTYTQGAVAETVAHCTLLYGLLDSGPDWQDYVDEVLDGWILPDLVVDTVDSFPSPYPNEDYSCIVAKLVVGDDLLEGHQRLQLLPHIDTFPGYTPHVTLAYVNSSATKKWVDALGKKLNGKKLPNMGINYGS